MLDLKARYRQNPVVAIEDFGERSLALHCEELRFIEINATAHDLVRRLDEGMTLEEAAAAMARDYDQPLEIIVADAAATVADMVALDLLQPLPVSETEPLIEEAT